MLAARRYTPGKATVADLLEHQNRLGIDRVVLIQPSVYGTDNRCITDALRGLGNVARGVAVVAPTTSEAELRSLHEAGVRGVRVNLQVDDEQRPERGRARVEEIAARVEHLGWHVEVFMSLAMVNSLHDTIQQLPTTLVVDHFGLADPSLGVSQDGFDSLLSLLVSGHIYLKLSAAYLVADDIEDALVGELAAATIAANPERVLWGSNWPHLPGRPGDKRNPERVEPFRRVDDQKAISSLCRWASDPRTVHQILVDNPAELYGF